MDLPLTGVRVVELGSNIAGPYGAWILAELGADVIKVERPEVGDDARSWGPPFWRGTATVFHAINRNKRSVALDLKDAKARAALRRFIVEDADVLLQNLRPGAIDQLGLDADGLLADNPRLIHCNLRAFGTAGPLRDRPGYDALMQAFGGVMSVTGEDGGAPVRAGVSVIDKGTGMWCAIGILAALNRRHRTGRGGVIDASLFETALGWMAFYTADHQVTGENPKRHGSGVRGITPYRAYTCADGELVVAAPNDRLFRKLAAVLGHPEWADDPRFRGSPDRAVHREALNDLIAGILRPRSRAYWQERLDDAGIPNAPIQAVDEVIAHPQTEALGQLQAAGVDGMRLGGLPISIDGERPPLRIIAPELGEADEALLGRLKP